MGKWALLGAGLTVSFALLTALIGSGMAQYAQLSAPPEAQRLQWPLQVENTQLVALELAEYEGPFYEDDSGEEVAGVTALVVENRGGTAVYQGRVELLRGDRWLIFDFTWLPPGAKVLVPERGRTPFQPLPVTGCKGWCTGIYPEYSGAVTAQALSGGIRLVNHTTQTVAQVSVVYRTFDKESGMYIGGIACAVDMQKLPPGDVLLDCPYRYSPEDTRLVGVLVTAEP